MAETPQIRTSPLAEAFGKITAFLDQGEQVISALRADPGNTDALKHVLDLLEVLRDGHDAVIDIKKQSVALRYAAMAAAYGAEARVRVADIADAAGVGDSMVSRVAHELGVPKRTVRTPSPREAPGSSGQ